ncbi:MAG TPA: hypothetical protein VFV54_01605 [Thermoanaerobaculia bacterium]|nr:hypothetical protein [Thermoanaerobaculia bacterium]
MKRNLVFAFSLLLIAASLSAAPTSAPGADALPLPATGTFTDATGGTGTFKGTFYLTKFAVAENVLVARGLLSGTLVNSAGVTLGSVMKSVSIPVTNAGGSAAAGVATMAVGTTAICDVLHLELGPLDLDLLGLVVHLDQIVLDIDAESGGGNLLGNLLCAVVGLLDGAGALADIANYLNQILDILSGLLG